MNHRHCFAFTLILALGIASAAFGQARTTALPSAIKTSESLSDEQRNRVEKWIAGQLDDLQGNDPDAVKAAREALSTEVQAPPANNATVGYMDVYAELLNKHIAALAKHPSMLVRLNAAIVTARVAKQAQNWRLGDAALAFMNDDTEPVAIWGLRAGQFTLPSLVRPPPLHKDILTPAILPVVKKFPRSGPIIEDAYDALSRWWEEPNTVREMRLTEHKPLMDVLNYRLGEYKRRVPPDPPADGLATARLVGKIWSELNKAQQSEVTQAAMNLVSMICQQVAGNIANRPLLDDVFRTAGGAIWVIGQNVKDNSIVDASTVLIKAAAAQAPAAQIQQQCQALLQTLQANKDFNPPIATPPQIEKIAAPETEPAETDAADAAGDTNGAGTAPAGASGR